MLSEVPESTLATTVLPTVSNRDRKYCFPEGAAVSRAVALTWLILRGLRLSLPWLRCWRVSFFFERHSNSLWPFFPQFQQLKFFEFPARWL